MTTATAETKATTKKAKRTRHAELHRSGRAAWLRAAVLGADDGVVSTAALMIGVAASSASNDAVYVAGAAGIAAGALSMAAGEFVSVSSQRDSELADIDVERRELAESPEQELEELAGIYRGRGLEPALARQVAEQLTAHDPLRAHLQDELGLDVEGGARPLQASVVSALSFASFAVVPMLALWLAPLPYRIPAMAGSSVVALFFLGGAGGVIGGASFVKAGARVVVGGGLAMAVTALIGHLFNI